ncbi:hypothetical protein [Achromobacter agilis]|uniref:Uncharacterized protein n=1 Tax=Achromobacter agilis TaxID=1353888 RepID=A0A446C5C2_9BURK|nr:hypothetical protein [Achromobacter agilis]SSW63020.1 hypothetical protein AGI3411_00872 [Achromobacter agilis]
MRITLTSALCGALIIAGLTAGPPSLAQSSGQQSVLRDIGGMLTGAKPGDSVQRTERGLLLETRHCTEGQTPVSALMRGRLGIEQEETLLALFERILCARSDDGMGQLNIARFGGEAADPFATGLVFYSGSQELGEWPAKPEGESPRNEAYISMLGLSPDSPIGGVSLWDVQAPGRVRVWFAPFLHMPSDAMTYDFELRGGRWVWVAGIASVRM